MKNEKKLIPIKDAIEIIQFVPSNNERYWYLDKIIEEIIESYNCIYSRESILGLINELFDTLRYHNPTKNYPQLFFMLEQGELHEKLHDWVYRLCIIENNVGLITHEHAEKIRDEIKNWKGGRKPDFNYSYVHDNCIYLRNRDLEIVRIIAY